MSRSYRFAVLGRSISYSKSPAVFAVIGRLTEIPISFEIRSIGPDELGTEVERLRGASYDAFALTTPFKEAIIPLLNSIDPVAQKIQSVNSVRYSGGKLSGFNTDVDGFLDGLGTELPSGGFGKALVLGSGGAARAVIYALLRDKLVSSVTLASRSKSPITKIAGFEMEFLPAEELSKLKDNAYQLIVNCTPLGGWNAPDTLPLPERFRLAPKTIYYDLNYNENNRAIKFAADRGCKTIDGSTMLVGQAVKSFLLWTGQSVSVQPVLDLVFRRDVRG